MTLYITRIYIALKSILPGINIATQAQPSFVKCECGISLFLSFSQICVFTFIYLFIYLFYLFVCVCLYI